VSAPAARPPHALVCGLYSEDRADAKHGTLERVVRGMLRLVEEHAKLRHIDFSPVARGVSGSYWKTKKSKDLGARNKRTTLLKGIATELLRGRVMFFHVDGDCIWAESKRAAVWDELTRFRRDLRAQAAHAQLGDLGENQLEHAFIAVVPFYSMENWTYASTDHLRTLTRDARELERIDGWAAALGDLDEVPRIKRELPSIQDKHNRELAQRIPAAALHAAGKSYTATVERVRASDLIRAGLAETLQRPW
jgi:hypothetical protein